MIAYVKGTLEHIFDTSIVVENNGLGYLISVSNSTIGGLPSLHKPIQIFTHYHLKEDGLTLFGFLSMEEIKIFNLLISVSGIGPKVAQGILSTISPSQLMLAIVTDDYTTLSKAPGVGKKTAARMVLELKDKIKTHDVGMGEVIESNTEVFDPTNSDRQDAIDALTTLGYSRSEAVKTVFSIYTDGMPVEQIIKLSLKQIARMN